MKKEHLFFCVLSNIQTFIQIFDPYRSLKMVMTRFGRAITRKLDNGISSQKGRIFNQDGLAMDSIDVEPLRSVSMAFGSYVTSEEDVTAIDTTKQESPSPIKESPNIQGPKLERNLF